MRILPDSFCCLVERPGPPVNFCFRLIWLHCCYGAMHVRFFISFSICLYFVYISSYSIRRLLPAVLVAEKRVIDTCFCCIVGVCFSPYGAHWSNEQEVKNIFLNNVFFLSCNNPTTWLFQTHFTFPPTRLRYVKEQNREKLGDTVKYWMRSLHMYVLFVCFLPFYCLWLWWQLFCSAFGPK